MAQVVASAVVVASLYALLGAGYVLVYRATRVLNLAQGDMMTLGGYFLFALAAAVLYLVSPVDLVPDFIPVLGYLDDLLIAAIIVDGMLNFVNRGLVLKYWPGSPESLERLARSARVLAAWVPRRLKLRVFSGSW